jgi:prepilin-type N-terminal cleavage/methylation domain-containing protein
MTNIEHSRGFTLLELIVSIAAISLISVVLSQTFFTSLRSNTKTEVTKEVKQNGELALENLTRMVQNSANIVSVDTVCSDTGTNGQSLTLEDSAGNTTTLGCVLDSSSGTSITRLASTSATVSYLTGDHVTMGGTSCASSTLLFTCRGGTGAPTTISVSFNLAQAGTAVDQFEQASVAFQTSVTTRNTPQ